MDNVQAISKAMRDKLIMGEKRLELRIENELVLGRTNVGQFE